MNGSKACLRWSWWQIGWRKKEGGRRWGASEGLGGTFGGLSRSWLDLLGGALRHGRFLRDGSWGQGRHWESQEVCAEGEERTTQAQALRNTSIYKPSEENRGQVQNRLRRDIFVAEVEDGQGSPPNGLWMPGLGSGEPWREFDQGHDKPLERLCVWWLGWEADCNQG